MEITATSVTPGQKIRNRHTSGPRFLRRCINTSCSCRDSHSLTATVVVTQSDLESVTLCWLGRRRPAVSSPARLLGLTLLPRLFLQYNQFSLCVLCVTNVCTSIVSFFYAFHDHFCRLLACLISLSESMTAFLACLSIKIKKNNNKWRLSSPDKTSWGQITIRRYCFTKVSRNLLT